MDSLCQVNKDELCCTGSALYYVLCVRTKKAQETMDVCS